MPLVFWIVAFGIFLVVLTVMLVDTFKEHP